MLNNKAAESIRAAKAEQILKDGVPSTKPVETESYIDISVLPKIPKDLTPCERVSFEAYTDLAAQIAKDHNLAEALRAFTTSTPKKETDTNIAYLFTVFLDVFTELEQGKGCLLRFSEGEYWMFYNGLHWEKLEGKTEFKHLYKSLCSIIGIDEGVSMKPKVLNEVFGMLANKLIFKTSRFKQDINVTLIPCLNGVLEFNFSDLDGQNAVSLTKFREHRHEDNLMYCLNFNYEPQKIKMPIFEQYFKEVLPDYQTRLSLLEFVGSCFMKMGAGLNLEKVAVLLGNQKNSVESGSNGKSTFHKILKGVLGFENICEHSINQITSKQETGQRTRFSANGKIINCSGEMPKTFEEFDGIKSYVSNELRESRQLFKDMTIADQLPKLLINANKMPKGENTFGFTRRFLIYPFDVNIQGDKIDTRLDIKIVKSESAALLNAFACGLLRVVDNGQVRETDIMKNAIAYWKNEFSPVASFISECCTVSGSEQDRVTSKDIWSAFQVFAANEPQFKRVGKGEFIKEFKTRFKSISPNNVITFLGVKLANTSELF